MLDLADYARRIRRRSRVAAALFWGGTLMLVVDFTTRYPTEEKGEFAFVWIFLMAAGAWFHYRSHELPGNEIIQLAEGHNGLLTVTEIAAALHADPAIVQRTLLYLQSRGIARPCWEETDRNLWEFPDLTRLPVAQAVQIAQRNQGKITLTELIAAGHSVDVARQTFELLAQKGVAHEIDGGGAPTLNLNEPPPASPGA